MTRTYRSSMARALLAISTALGRSNSLVCLAVSAVDDDDQDLAESFLDEADGLPEADRLKLTALAGSW